MRVFAGELRGTVDLLAFGPGQRLAAACAAAGAIELWDAVTGTHADHWVADAQWIVGQGMLPDGRVVAAVPGEPLQVIDPGPYRKFGESFPSRYGLAKGVAVADDGRTLVTIQDADGWRLAVWRPGHDGRYDAEWAVLVIADSVSLAVSSDGRLVGSIEQVSGRTDVVVRDAGTGAERTRLKALAPGGYRRPALLDGGRGLAALGSGRLVVWDFATAVEFELTGEPFALTDLAAHPDGRYLLTAGRDGVVRVWDAGQEVRAYHWDVGRLGSVAVSRDGLLAAAGGEDGRIVVWDVDL